MMLVEQDVLGTNEGCAKLLKMIADDQLRQKVAAEIPKHKTSEDRWQAFVEVADIFNKQVRSFIINLNLQFSFTM